jgi:hypothetical protein
MLKFSTKLHAQSTKVLYHIIEKFVVELFPPTKFFYPSSINNIIKNIKFNYEFVDLKDFQTSQILITKNREDINNILDPPEVLCFIKNYLLNVEARPVKSSTESDFECEEYLDYEDIFSVSDDSDLFLSSLSDDEDSNDEE